MMWIVGLVALLVLLVAAAAAVMVARAQSRHSFACTCGREFRPRWTQLVFEVHALDQHRLKCPHCGRTDFCRDLGGAIDA